ncbi:MAG: hypothetical protein RBS32_01640 [Aliarcobacter sp.]|jgi:hypothetical protein|nr:hypothetical protein [Aliarcobacter sp.]
MSEKINDKLENLFKSKQYEEIRILSGVELHKRIKLEFAIRDNIDNINTIILFYDQNGSKLRELNSNNSYQLELEIMFKKLTIPFYKFNDIEHCFINLKFKSVCQIYRDYIERNYIESKNINYYSLEDNINVIENNDTYITTVIKKENSTNFEINTIIEFDSYQNDVSIVKDNIKDFLKNKYIEHYLKTDILMVDNENSYINTNLSINLALPEEILVEWIKNISRKYKNGEISKNILETKKIDTIFNRFKNVGMKYIQDGESFARLMFIYDVLKEKSHTEEELENFLKIKIKNINTAINKTLKNKLYLQL